MPTRYFISLPDGAAARGGDPAFSFTAHGAEEFAHQLQSALRSTDLFDRWRAAQDEPDDVDAGLGAVDPSATVTGRQDDLHIDLVVDTRLSSALLRQRMALLAGSHWQLRDVTAA